MSIEITICGQNDESLVLEVETDDFFEAQEIAWQKVREHQTMFRDNARLSFQFQSSFAYFFRRLA